MEPRKANLGSEMLHPRRQLAVFALGWFGFKVIGVFVQLFVFMLFKMANPNAILETTLYLPSYQIVVNTVIYLALLIALTLISRLELKKLLVSFKQYQSYIAAAICFAAIIGFTILYSIFTNLAFGEVSVNENQSSLNSIENNFPITSMLVIGFVTPICEEITYRVGLFSFFKRRSKALAYGVTIIVFALIHFSFLSENMLVELINLPYYLFAAAAFSFVYDNYGFAASVTAHMLNNVVAIILNS